MFYAAMNNGDGHAFFIIYMHYAGVAPLGINYYFAPEI